jgi:hypothetical protein
MIVVPVLMISCHVSENPKIGPVTAHIMITSTASMKVVARPAANEILLAVSPNNLASFPGVLGFSSCRGCLSDGLTMPSLSCNWPGLNVQARRMFHIRNSLVPQRSRRSGIRIVSAIIMAMTLDRSVVQAFQGVANAMADREIS